MEMPAGRFKAQCLKLMDEVQKFHKEIVIRLKYTTKALILLYLLFYLLDIYFFIKEGTSLATLLCLIGCIGSMYL